MIHILYGEDDFSLHQFLDGLKTSVADESLRAFNTTELEAQVTVDELMRACETAPFLAEKRLVIVRGLLSRFEAKSRPNRKKDNVPSSTRDDHKPFALYLDKIPASTALVLVDGKLSAGNPLLKALAAKAKVKEFPALNPAGLRQWTEKRVADKGGSISPHAVEQLAGLVGSDLWIMTNETDKLLLFCAGRRIEEDDVKALVSSAQEANIFTMVDAVIDRKAGTAQQLLGKLLVSGAAPAYILLMLTRQVRMIVRARDLKRQGKTEAEIRTQLALKEFAARRTLEQTGRYSWERLKEIYARLLEADLAIKTGRYEPDLALNILVTELCSTASFD